jgi:hypothetical protein
MAPKTKTAASEAVTAAGEVEMKPVSEGYADVNAVNAVSRDLRRGRTPVLIHGGLTTIADMRGWVRPLAKTRRVIAVEMQASERSFPEHRFPRCPRRVSPSVSHRSLAHSNLR